MEITLIRHGYAESNFLQTVTGSENHQLHEIGRTQAKKLSLFFSKGDYDIIYSSAMNRAIETANIVSNNSKIIIDARLNELNAGNYSDISIKDFLKIKPNFFSDFNPHWRFPDGESHNELSERVIAFLLQIKNSTYSKIAIFCHSGTISSILHHIYDVPLTEYSRFFTLHTSVTKIKYEHKKSYPVLLEFNNTNHLELK